MERRCRPEWAGVKGAETPAEGRARHLAAAVLEHVIRDGRDYERHVDYIHYNPVKHGHVARVADWPHSSFHRFV
jgi:putative transposase